MEAESPNRRYLSYALWAAVLVAVYLTYARFIAPNAAGISLNSKILVNGFLQIGRVLVLICGGMALLEGYLYLAFYRQPRNPVTAVVMRVLQGGIAFLALMFVVVFLSDIGGLFELGEGAVGAFFRYPLAQFDALTKTLTGVKSIGKDNAGAASGLLLAALLLAALAVIYFVSQPRNSQLGLAYLLIAPALVGIAFLIFYPFLFEIRLAFSNASLGTKATKEASYGLIYGWQNLVTLFTGNVAKEAKFFDVFIRTILWTAINVTFHVTGGMILALLLNRPMKLQGVYRTLLVFPWAVPGTIAALSLRNEFDNRYGLFNILLTDLHNFIVSLGPAFAWLQSIGPVSWKQDPFWAFVSVCLANIWLGIPFMSVIILGGLQSISSEYYEAAEIDGASKWQQFWNVTIPLLRPVLTPSIILGTVWTFNKFDVIYLISQGGPQEKTDILVSSMYKAAFQFYRYGFTAMFALVIFVILLIFALVYIRISGGLKSAYD